MVKHFKLFSVLLAMAVSMPLVANAAETSASAPGVCHFGRVTI